MSMLAGTSSLELPISTSMANERMLPASLLTTSYILFNLFIAHF